MNNDEQKKRNKITLICGVSIFVAIIVVSVIGIIYNNFLQRTKIVEVTNYGEYLPDDKEQELGLQLRNLMQLTLDIDDKAIVTGDIRDGTYEEDYSDGVYSATFLIDIDSYKQTYEVIMDWSDEVEILNGTLISCPDADKMKYPNVNCVGMYNDTQSVEEVANNPFYNELPIVVEWFDFASRINNRYEIRGYFDNGKLVVVIVDYSGGNYENALAKIREMGYIPENYAIDYIDKSGS